MYIVQESLAHRELLDKLVFLDRLAQQVRQASTVALVPRDRQEFEASVVHLEASASKDRRDLSVSRAAKG